MPRVAVPLFLEYMCM